MIRKKLPLTIEINFDSDSYKWVIKCLKLLPRLIVERYFNKLLTNIKEEK